VPAILGPTHAYIGAVPGCWRVYSEVLAEEYVADGASDCLGLIVDAYAVQHPGVESRQAVRSVAGHLISIRQVIEAAADGRENQQRLRAALAGSERFRWLDPPSFEGTITILDVSAAERGHARRGVVRAWAESVWRAWGPHHAEVRRWAEAVR
jgi:hypothetical protein